MIVSSGFFFSAPLAVLGHGSSTLSDIFKMDNWLLSREKIVGGVDKSKETS